MCTRVLLTFIQLVALSIKIVADTNIDTTTIDGSIHSNGPLRLRRSPACWQSSRLKGNSGISPEKLAYQYDKVVVLGDVHGDLSGMLEVLQEANVIMPYMNHSDASPSSLLEACQWNVQAHILLIQMGDVIDRGRYSTEAVHCLRHLQATADQYQSKVIRLLGNHELLWLEGQPDFRNKETDTPEKVKSLTKTILMDVLEGRQLGSYFLLSYQDIPIVFSHAGLRKSLKERILQENLFASVLDAAWLNANPTLASKFSKYINTIISMDMKKCHENFYPKLMSPTFNHTIACRDIMHNDIYSASADRGGDGIGGVYWTDYSTLTSDATNYGRNLLDSNLMTTAEAWNHESETVDQFVQIVGHSVKRGKIRSVEGVLSVCVDVGIYLGGRGFLEIRSDGRFIAHEQIITKKRKNHAKKETNQQQHKQWNTWDIMDAYC